MVFILFFILFIYFASKVVRSDSDREASKVWCNLSGSWRGGFVEKCLINLRYLSERAWLKGCVTVWRGLSLMESRCAHKECDGESLKNWEQWVKRYDPMHIFKSWLKLRSGLIKIEILMVNFMYQSDYAIICPDIWSNVILRVSVVVCWDAINMQDGRLSKADCLLFCAWSHTSSWGPE